MDNLEKELYRLEKPEPSSKFCRESKTRLVNRIVLHENESLFLRLFKKVFRVGPSPFFSHVARTRLLFRIEAIKQPVSRWLLFTKRLAATTLVMMIAVSATLFFVGAKQPVIASENTFLEVMGGEVAVKHADRLIWDVITEQTELSAGDLIRLGDSASAVVHFFDDSQLRLAENSTLLVSRLDVSPGYARQGIIKTSLHEGRAWVQTLNADDGYTQFTLITRDAIVSTQKASFDVQTDLFEPTLIRVFKHGAEVSVLREDTRDIVASDKLNFYQQISLTALSPYQRQTELKAFAPIIDLTDKDRSEEWVVENLNADRVHLANLREREINHLRLATGTLPGQVFYPLKRARERLSLALSFGEESGTNAQINIANERLNEAIVLIGQGETARAKLALMEYQNLVRHITEAESDLPNLSNQVVTTHKKTLVAALPGDAEIGIVKQVLNRTEELLAEDPVERTEIRLQNGLEDLIHVQDLVEAGELESAKEALIEQEILASSLLEQVTLLENDEQKKVLYRQILETQYEQQRLLSEMGRQLAKQTNHPLAVLVENAHSALKEDIKHTAAVVRPLLPDVVLSYVVILPEDEKVIEFVNKVNIYQTAQGQKNQIKRLLSKHLHYAQDQVFLTKVRSRLNSRAQDEINVYLLDLRREKVIAKSKVVKRKIDRAKREREERAE